METTVTIKADASELTDLLAELTDIAQQLSETGLSIPDPPLEFIRFDADALPAPAANEYLIRLKPTDSFLEFAAALRAINRERLAG